MKLISGGCVILTPEQQLVIWNNITTLDNFTWRKFTYLRRGSEESSWFAHVVFCSSECYFHKCVIMWNQNVGWEKYKCAESSDGI